LSFKISQYPAQPNPAIHSNRLQLKGEFLQVENHGIRLFCKKEPEQLNLA
jgi:hypothetical protein